MVLRSSFFNSVAGDRVYDASNFASYFASFIGNGVFPNPSTNLQVLQNSNLTVTVSPGKGFINGYYVENTAPIELTLATADGTFSRIDRVVMGLSLSSRSIDIYVKQGEVSSNPSAPALTRNGTVVELALADINVTRATINIAQSNITDQRPNGNLCGFVSGIVNQVDTTTLFNQYQARYNEQALAFESASQDLIALEQANFETWFQGIMNTLSGDVAGNLANQINGLDFKIDNNKSLTDAELATTNNSVGNALGRRISIPSGTDILSLDAGRYEGTLLVNSPLPANDTAFLEIDVSVNPGSLRKQLSIIQSKDGAMWTRTIHIEGTPQSGSGGWERVMYTSDTSDSGWLNASLTSPITGSLRYRRIIVNGLSTIHVSCVIRGATSTTNNFFQFSNLPVGYRPSQVLRQLDSGGFGPENSTRHAFMQISESGNCFFVNNNPDPTAAYVYYFTYIL